MSQVEIKAKELLNQYEQFCLDHYLPSLPPGKLKYNIEQDYILDYFGDTNKIINYLDKFIDDWNNLDYKFCCVLCI